MKTENLIELLARGAGPAPNLQAERRLAWASGLGMLVSALLTVGTLGLVPAPMFAGTALWAKLAYAGLLVVAAGMLAGRLGRPGASARRAWQRTAAIVAAMAVVGLLAWGLTPAPDRMPALWGHSWARCPWAVLVLSLPALAASLWVMRSLAPVRSRLAGFATGLFAGAAGAAGYSLGCTEESLAFVAVWYSLGIALTGGLGALLGPRLLRW